ncbi:MAG: hypothetical protein RLN88_09275 [Ekhidna sp.]|uniref:hypothetical protein n=1 Tax=Ekhidna sp. TaxID=2608089 RepID=UPI0032EAFCB9
MKKIVYVIIGVITLFLIILLSQEEKYVEKHPTLNTTAEMPDLYLRNVAYYADADKMKQSAHNLEKAIESIWKIEQDVDDASFAKLERAIKDLEIIHHAMLTDSLEGIDMSQTFEYALDNLARAELEVSEMYAETNNMDNANIALKYAQLHIKNAMLFHDGFWDSDTVQLAIERRVFEEMDSLSKNKSITPVEYVITIDKMIKEIDQILKLKD